MTVIRHGKREARCYRAVTTIILLSLIVIGSNVLGNYALKRGVAHTGVGATWSPVVYIHAFSRGWVDAGVLFMLAWFSSRLALLGWADLSYVLPLTSLSYVLNAIAGVVLLNEHVSAVHWFGTCVVALGAAITIRTYPDTTSGIRSTE